jgi:hypothetical protein
MRLFGTFFPGFGAHAGKHGEKQTLGKPKTEMWDAGNGSARTSSHRVLAFHTAEAENLADFRHSAARNSVKEQLGGSDKSLLKLYFFFTGLGFF